MRLFLLLLLFPALAFASGLPTTGGSGTALEGDTVSVNGSAVKLWGIDAPEMGQTCKDARGRDYDCFERSKQALSRLIGRNQVECHMRGKAIGRQIGTCAVNGLDLAAMMVRDGWAMAYHGLSHQYVDLEGIAQARKRGIWSGHAEAPWLWRTARNNRNK